MAGRRSARARPDEDFAETAFHRFLERLGPSTIAWAPGEDPPDRVLTVGVARFAVEVTQVMETVELDGLALPDRGVTVALQRFAAAIEQEAQLAGVLSGQYVLSLEPIPRLGDRRDDLAARALAYFATTAALPSSPPALLASFENGALVHVEKVAPDGAAVLPITGPADAKWGGQVVHQLAALVRSAIATKAVRLATVNAPKVLLLVDAYLYGRSEEWAAAVTWAGPHPFHTVARVYGEYRCQVLCSADPSWLVPA